MIRRWREQPERGSIAPAIPIIALVLLLLGGLVIDASRQLNARGQAMAIAEEAARAGVQAVILNEFGEAELVAADVPPLVAEYCSAVLPRPEVTQCALERVEAATSGSPRPFTVVVGVQLELPASLLGIVGVRTLSASGSGRAQPQEGTLVDLDDP